MEYNFYDIYKALEQISISIDEANVKTDIEDGCDKLKNALNKFMPDFKCRSVILTPNFDKNFFGVMVLPNICEPSFIDNWFAGHCASTITREYADKKADCYTLELDGKLFRDTNLSIRQLWAIILGEISSVNSPAPYNVFKTRMDSYIALNDISIDREKIFQFKPVFYLVSAIMIHNVSSVFTNYYFEDAYIPSIVEGYGLGEFYDEAINILSLKRSVETLVDHTNVALTWYFKNYKDLYNNRYIDSLLRGVIKTEASSLIRDLAYEALKALVKVDDDLNNFMSSSITEATKRKGLMYQLKHNGLKSIEDDLFEYNMRLRNVETQDDAILLMRQINSRMSILEEYIRNNPDDEEKERWNKCYKDYLSLRESLSKKTVYNKKMYGLFVDYNALQTMSQNGQLMNTYY